MWYLWQFPRFLVNFQVYQYTFFVKKQNTIILLLSIYMMYLAILTGTYIFRFCTKMCFMVFCRENIFWAEKYDLWFCQKMRFCGFGREIGFAVLSKCIFSVLTEKCIQENAFSVLTEFCFCSFSGKLNFCSFWREIEFL